MALLPDAVPEDLRPLMRKSRQPSWIDPMKATLEHDPFSDDGWVFEPKLYGERCLAFVDGEKVRLLSRNRKEIGGGYPEIVTALVRRKLPPAIFDGEIVALDGDVASFARLQKRMHVIAPSPALVKSVPVVFYIFDVIYIDGYDVTSLPLLARKKLLRSVMSFRAPLRAVPHRKAEGEAYLQETCAKPGHEGIIAKRVDSTYQPRRSRDWLKLKCSKEQEFVIAGYTDPQGAREGFGALLIGYYDRGSLRYAGKVGTGYDTAMLRMLTAELEKRTTDASPFSEKGVPRQGVHWVVPELVGQVGYAEWTRDGRLRHPRFMGLRRDKDAKDVVREDR